MRLGIRKTVAFEKSAHELIFKSNHLEQQLRVFYVEVLLVLRLRQLHRLDVLL